VSRILIAYDGSEGARRANALANARDRNGLLTRRWDGTPARTQRLLTPGSTLMLLAAVTAAPPPLPGTSAR
jgi:hypothetical protein